MTSIPKKVSYLKFAYNEINFWCCQCLASIIFFPQLLLRNLLLKWYQENLVASNLRRKPNFPGLSLATSYVQGCVVCSNFLANV